MSLIDIARQFVGHTVCAAKDALHLNGRNSRHVDNGTTGDTLIIAGTKDILDVSAEQVDNSSCLDTRRISSSSSFVYTHTDTTIVTGTEHHQVLVSRLDLVVFRNINQHIAAVLHDVAIGVLRKALSGTIDTVHSIAGMSRRLEMNEGTFHAWLGEGSALTGHTSSFSIRNSRFVFRIGVSAVIWICIVDVTIAATKDIVDTALGIFHISRGDSSIGIGISICRRNRLVCRIVDRTTDVFTNLTNKVLCTCRTTTIYMSTHIVTAIEMVANPREASHRLVVSIRPLANVCLRMTIDVGIT